MIIQLRGTSGSGKSTIVREVMKRHLFMTPIFREGRRKPIGYYSGGLWVVGHYETESGGCDTIARLDDVYAEVELAAQKGYNVLYEGIMASGEYRRCVALSKEHKLAVLALNTPIEECIVAILERRLSRGNTKPLDEARTRRRAKEVTSMMEYLLKAGVSASWVSREEALRICLETFT